MYRTCAFAPVPSIQDVFVRETCPAWSSVPPRTAARCRNSRTPRTAGSPASPAAARRLRRLYCWMHGDSRTSLQHQRDDRDQQHRPQRRPEPVPPDGGVPASGSTDDLAGLSAERLGPTREHPVLRAQRVDVVDVRGHRRAGRRTRACRARRCLALACLAPCVSGWSADHPPDGRGIGVWSR